MDCIDEPRPEDFGITADDLERAPCVWLAGHRPHVITIVYAASAMLVFAVIVVASGSLSAAGFFTVVLLAAGSVLLLPVVVLALCISEQAEERWLCARFPKLRACRAYRRAVANHVEQLKLAAARAASPDRRWSVLSLPALVEAVTIALERVVDGTLQARDRAATGVDLSIVGSGRHVLVRCQPGPEPVEAPIAREVSAALGDLGGDSAVIVSAGGTTPSLDQYIEARPIVVVRPWELEDGLPEIG
jgi:hypothetical protein